ncbi:MAG: helix-turn-helix transcriptional regulator [Taibaiella sp.]|nr:helix-turn-helix transcriptional regulator [Taibaiella sp.]
MKNKLPRIVKIAATKHFVITTLWSNGEMRTIDFNQIFDQWEQAGDTVLLQLKDPLIFQSVAVSPGHTLWWPFLAVTYTFNGITSEAPVDLDPDVLYQNSTLIQGYDKPDIGILLKQARIKAGLSQLEVAKNSGTSRTYISKIENHQADIQMETLFKIISLGIGKQLKISIE